MTNLDHHFGRTLPNSPAAWRDRLVGLLVRLSVRRERRRAEREFRAVFHAWTHCTPLRSGRVHVVVEGVPAA